MTKKVDKRTSSVERKTNETEIIVKVNLDGSGNNDVETGLPFFDHMIEQLSKHSLIDIDAFFKKWADKPKDKKPKYGETSKYYFNMAS